MHSQTPFRLRTYLALVLAVLLVAQLAPAFGASPGSSADHFRDDDRSIHEGSINAIAEAGLVVGCNPPENDEYCPDRPITREEMAAIVARVVGVAPSARRVFTDVDESVHEDAISGIGAVGIARGCNPPANDQFCPTDIVDRGQMAAFLARALELPEADYDFADTDDSVFKEDIAKLAGAGITLGCNPPANDLYCPERSMTRGEMASMLTRALGLAPIVIDHPDPTTTTTTTNTAPPSTSPPTGGGSFAGDPADGMLYWGSHNTRHEAAAGHPLAVHRSFFQWHHRTGYVLRTIEEDVAAGRLSWVSLKTPSWAAMAAGNHDDEIDELLLALKNLKVDVWLTMHHEPEGGGGVNSPDDPAGPSGHLAMNRRVRERIEALNVTNVALAPILMTWTWESGSGRNPDEWWAPGVYDFLGVDHYKSDGSLVTDRWYEVRAWAAARGVPVAVGEWGLLRSDATGAGWIQEWFDHAADSHRDGRGARVIGLAYFDSDTEYSGKVWALKGEALERWKQLLNDPRNAQAH